MAQIQSGASADLLTVDPTSKAARVTLYDSTGREIMPKATGAYCLGFQVRHTTAAAAAVTVFNMRGPPSLTAYVKRIIGTMGFDGTALAASGTLRYGFFRGSGPANASGGGANVSPAATAGKKRASYGNLTLNNFTYDQNGTGLTTTGITYETQQFAIVTLPVVSLQVAAPTTSATSGPVVPYEINFAMEGTLDQAFELGANEHIGIQLLTVSAIIGLTISGRFEWDER